MGMSIESPTRPDEKPDVYPALDDLIKGVSVALLTTVDATGIMHTRQLPNTNRRCSGDHWFLASLDSPLVREVNWNPDVLITYASRGTGQFVVVNGEAYVREDPDRVRELWHPTLASWLPGGPDDPALVLLQVKVSGIDFWE